MAEYDTATDPRSSNSLIHAYLASKGLPLTSENVSRALAANIANRGTIAGLINSSPSTDEEDQEAMAAARGGAGAGGSRGIPTPPVPPTGDGAGNTSAAPGNTSAAPGANVAIDTSDMPIWQQIALGAATGAGFAGGSRIGRNGKQAGVGEAGLPDISLSVNRPAIEAPAQPAVVGDRPGSIRLGGPDVNPGVTGVEQPRLLPSAGRIGQLSGPGPQFQISGPDEQFQITGPEAQKQLSAPRDPRPVADPNTAIPLQRPAAPDVIELPKPRVRVQAGSSAVEENPVTGNVPLEPAAPTAPTRAKTARARARRIPVRVP